MDTVIVTGGSGKTGSHVIRALIDHGYRPVNLDTVPPRRHDAPFSAVDMTDFGQVLDAFRGIDMRHGGAEALIHLAAVPGPGHRPDEVTFRANVTSTYNVFAAATRLGVRRVVWASSSSVMGAPFGTAPPPYAPLDEAVPVRAEWSYALSKVLGEEMARQFSALNPQIPFVGLRIANIMEPEDYVGFADFWSDSHARAWNLWAYVDVRDVAAAVRLGLEAEVTGAELFIVAAADTVMDRPSRTLMAEVYPGVPVREALGEFESLMSSAKARERLGYTPRHSWRSEA